MAAPTKRRPDLLEPLRRAITGTTRAIAGNADIDVTFSTDPPGRDGKTLRLPELPARVTPDILAVVRGHADSLALQAACHDDKLHAKLAPASSDARAVFTAVERARVEALGAKRMEGVADNLTAKTNAHYETVPARHVAQREDAPADEALALLVREALTGERPPEKARPIAEAWRPMIDQHAASLMRDLANAVEDQDSFGHILREMLAALDLAEDMAEEQEQQSEAKEEGEGEDSSAQGEEQASAEEEKPAEPDKDDSAEAEGAEQAEMSDLSEMDRFEDSDDGAQRSEGPPRRPNTSVLDAPANFGYEAFTTEFDEIINAEALCESEELGRLRSFLDKQLPTITLP